MILFFVYLDFHVRARDNEGSTEFSDAIETQAQAEDRKSHELPLFSFNTVMAATGGFSQSNFLGKGGFGSVFKVKPVFFFCKIFALHLHPRLDDAQLKIKQKLLLRYN